MGNADSHAWKVDGEEKYFRKISDTEWGEYDNGRHVFSFEFTGSSGNRVYLRKKGWLMYLELGPDAIIYGESPDNLDKHLYNGGWVNALSSEAPRRPQPKPQPQVDYCVKRSG